MIKFLDKRTYDDSIGFKKSFDAAMMFIEFAVDGTITSANPKFLQALGYRLDEVIGRNRSMLLAPEERGGAQAFWQRLSGGEPQSALIRHVGKNGDSVWLRSEFAAIHCGESKLAKVSMFATNVDQMVEHDVELEGQVAAINRSQAVIEFSPAGIIIKANENFLAATGYALEEIVGQHHSMFVDPVERSSRAYTGFWQSLAKGEFQAAEYKRFGKGGKEIWIQATYNPVLDRDGSVVKIVKFATDITAAKLRALDQASQIDAIRKSQAVIEFNMDGTVIDANDNFLGALGYSLKEIVGEHHRMFVPVADRESAEYQEFWAALRRGEYRVAEYKRVGKGGREVWIQASYNPILDFSGRPYKVVKYAADVTQQVMARQRNEQVCGLIESVATGAQQMNASVQEIAVCMQKSKATAEVATARVMTADQAAERFTHAAQAMGGIVNLIAGIANQINLLALNATIESSRAGEAGRGFAVVANEVKLLAAQAKDATTKIGGEIDGLHGVLTDVVGSLKGIRTAINSVGEYMVSTSVSVEQQSAVTAEMSSSMNRAVEILSLNSARTVVRSPRDLVN
ncbi:PAS domain S-box protein [Lacibacterium aquatile]|uniref:PAS domain S-box protein n=1 Tax=Lacibacterium aquatile TaxID=1168082 RepID=A0ABW5DL23_9PROT